MKLGKLFVSLLICYAVAAAGSAVTTPFIASWYPSLIKPPFTPPNAVFGPVWTILYTLMAISLTLIWSKHKAKQTKEPLEWFAVQLGLNFLWSLVFFSWHQVLWAFLVIVLLLLAIVQTIRVFLPLSKTAAYLLIPYVLWVSFAGILNLAIVLLNR